jgi:multimeric flavodoxin WrbA
MKILGIIGSPRKGSNTTILLEELLGAARQAGAETQTIAPAKMKLAPCIACEGCYKTGRCIVKDDFQLVYDMILASDALVLATPVYFGAVSAQVKPLIDRIQCFWAMRDVVRAPMPPAPAGAPRKGILIATCGMLRAEMLTGPRLTFRFMMRSLQGEFWAELTRMGMDAPGHIRQDQAAMERARDLGRRLACGEPAESGPILSA